MNASRLVLSSAFNTLAMERVGRPLTLKESTALMTRYANSENKPVEVVFDEWIQALKEAEEVSQEDLEASAAMWAQRVTKETPLYRLQGMSRDKLGHTLNPSVCDALLGKYACNQQTLEDVLDDYIKEHNLATVETRKIPCDDFREPFIVELKVELVYKFNSKYFPRWFNERGVNAAIEDVLSDLNRPITLSDLGDNGLFGQGPEEILFI